MKDKEARVTCPSQKCQRCEQCVFASRLDEWEMDLMPINLGHDTPLDERLRLDTAIEASVLAG